jgi:hypothetical protein
VVQIAGFASLAAGFVVALTAQAQRPACPPETAWDGIACAHPRATCGAWDGISCDPKPGSFESDRIARAELTRIDDDARAICPEEDDARQVYVGGVADVLKATDAALGGAAALDRRHPG